MRENAFRTCHEVLDGAGVVAADAGRARPGQAHRLWAEPRDAPRAVLRPAVAPAAAGAVDGARDAHGGQVVAPERRVELRGAGVGGVEPRRASAHFKITSCSGSFYSIFTNFLFF